jgi:hypothetical protein
LDLPNDLLDVLEEGTFEITELARETAQTAGSVPGARTVKTRNRAEKRETAETAKVKLRDIADPQPVPAGRVTCRQFPFIVMTSNGEREFPAPFLRRCIQVKMLEPSPKELEQIVRAHLGELESQVNEEIEKFITDFVERRKSELLATDQLLNAAFMVLTRGTSGGLPMDDAERREVSRLILNQLTTVQK